MTGAEDGGAAPRHRSQSVDVRIDGSVGGSIVIGDDNTVVGYAAAAPASAAEAADAASAAIGPAAIRKRPPVTAGSGTRSLSAGQVSELARIFHLPTRAAQVLAEAGIPPSVQPSWHGVTAEEFWREVSDLVGAGIIADGTSRILAAASRRFPANDVFQAPRENAANPF
jgi:hypothetical protein